MVVPGTSIRCRCMGEQEQRYLELFEQFQTTDIAEPKVKNPSTPVWTENKARLVERYLFLFVLVTHSGTYIDGFAGPQEPEREDMWSAKLVLESRPRWLQRFFLFEKDPKQVARLEQMVAIQPARDKSKKKNEPKRETTIIPGDSNAEIRGFSVVERSTESSRRLPCSTSEPSSANGPPSKRSRPTTRSSRSSSSTFYRTAGSTVRCRLRKKRRYRPLGGAETTGGRSRA